MQFNVGDRVIGHIYGRKGTVTGLIGSTVLVRFDDTFTKEQPVRSQALTLINEQENKMNATEAFNAMHDACGIGPGDTVRIVRGWLKNEYGVQVVAPGDYTFGGDYISSHIGKERVVIETLTPRIGTKYFVTSQGSFPFFAIQLVKKAKPAWTPRLIQITRDYSAVVHEDHIAVGCQKVTFNNFGELAKAVAEARDYAAS